MPNKAATLDVLFHALADPTRRGVVERLVQGPAAVTELAKPFRMALPSFLQHLRVLESAGLVASKKVGRTRVSRLNVRALDPAQHWLSVHRKEWETRLDQLDAFLEQNKETTQ